MSPARRYIAALRGGHLGSWLSVAGVVALIAFGVYQWHVLRGRETTDDAFVEGTLSFLAPEIAGRVVAILVDENQHVIEAYRQGPQGPEFKMMEITCTRQAK